MSKFIYKVAFFTHEVEVAQEMIAYKGKTIPANSITAIGIGLMNITKIAVGQALGGVVGGLLANKGFGATEGLKKDLSSLPESAMGQLTISYSGEDQQKQKVLRIPINTKDESCKSMLQEIARNFKDKFVGFGGLPLVEKELNISQKNAYIFVAVIILIILGFIALTLTKESNY